MRRPRQCRAWAAACRRRRANATSGDAAAALTQHVAPAARLPGCRGSVISVCREWRDVFCGLEGVWSHYQLTVGVGRMQKSSTAAAEWAEGTRSLLQRVAAHGCISSASIQARQGTCCSHLPAGWLLEDCLARLDPAVLLRLSLAAHDSALLQPLPPLPNCCSWSWAG